MERRTVDESRRDANATRALRRFHMVYDSKRKCLVLFGGATAWEPKTTRGDLWEWDGTSWSERRPEGGPRPSARSWHAMAYDSVRQRVMVFGGRDGSAQGLGDLWEWDGARWRERETPAKLTARYEARLAYDASRHVLVLFGGRDPATPTRLFNDLWEWDGKAWTERTPAGPLPAGRITHQMVYAEDRTLLFGGCTVGTVGADWPTLDDVWSWDGTRWTELHPVVRPADRNRFAIAWDPERQRVVVCSGWSGPPPRVHHDDVWEYESPGD